MLEKLSGIHREHISMIERGKVNANEKTRNKIESVLGKVDFIENQNVKLKNASYYQAERLVKRLVSITITMNPKDRNAINRLIHKYFN